VPFEINLIPRQPRPKHEKMNFSTDSFDEDAPMVSIGEWVDDSVIEAISQTSCLWNKWNVLHSETHGTEEFSTKGKYKHADFQASIDRGNAAEEQFVSNCLAMGASVRASSEHQDKCDRIDFFLQCHGSLVPLDVKALRSIKMYRGLQNRYMWIELHSNGSLFAGRNTCIALQYAAKKFVLLSKAALQEFVKAKFTNSQRVRWNQQALYRAYRREGKQHEWIGLIELVDCLPTCAVALIVA
jgi:hypothetical protein